MITAIGADRTDDTTALALALAGNDPGQHVTATVHRASRVLTVQVMLADLPAG